MWKEQYVLVGDLFESFSGHSDHVLTRSEFYTKLENEKVSFEKIRLWIGQGISNDDIALMIQATGNPVDAFNILGSDKLPKANRSRTHKQRSQNVLVSTARKVEDRLFELLLVLDEANEFLEDHMSGLHIQGMALVEASRQAFLSVTEQYYLSENKQDYYFVINSINIDYKAFLFPLPTRLRYRVLSEKISQNRLSFKVSIDLIQNDAVCAVSHIVFTAYEQEAIANKERQAASNAVERLIEFNDLSSDLNTAA